MFSRFQSAALELANLGHISSPKRLRQMARESGLDESDVLAIPAEVERIRRLRNDRRASRERTGNQDPLLLARYWRPSRAKQLRMQRRLLACPIVASWRADRRSEILRLARYADSLRDVDGPARKATLEAIRRAATAAGWNCGHTSTDRAGHASSRYLQRPLPGDANGPDWSVKQCRVRLSDHELPETAERADNRANGIGGNWYAEIVVSDWQSRSLADYLGELEAIFADWCEDKNTHE